MKAYSSLENPSDNFFEIAILWLQVFEMIFYDTPYISNIRQTVIKSVPSLLRITQYMYGTRMFVLYNYAILNRFITVSTDN
jgi:hypothetical protein